jgi:hypothetical protein
LDWDDILARTLGSEKKNVEDTGSEEMVIYV